MSITSDGCAPSPPLTSTQETGDVQNQFEDPPFSTSFPAFTALNRRRRVTCKFCDLPIGYADIGMVHLEALRCQKESGCKIAPEDGKYVSVSIASPINVSIDPRQQTACEASDAVNSYLTWIIEDADENAFTADKIICDGCKSSLGARITSYKMVQGDLQTQACDPPPGREELCQWFSFALDCVNIEPLFSLVGLRELSSWYHGGERFFHTFKAIEDSGDLSNNSRTWMHPHERMGLIENLDKEIVIEAWPFLLMDLVGASELPHGTLNHLERNMLVYFDNLDAFIKRSKEDGVEDDSVLTPRGCCSELELNEPMSEDGK
ncbi:unnamed protein product [Hydatigera taeniaeformis]|uniref:Ubiquitin-conjugating enzyme E2-binding protein n=1 Tax=Hydatigena taeniaeformis TaxID=6205 RepID=A0A0R3WV90_HYDTA|nr:unnamed protein product [Hydatigera taeniaeformis]